MNTTITTVRYLPVTTIIVQPRIVMIPTSSRQQWVPGFWRQDTKEWVQGHFLSLTCGP